VGTTSTQEEEIKSHAQRESVKQWQKKDKRAMDGHRRMEQEHLAVWPHILLLFGPC